MSSSHYFQVVYQPTRDYSGFYLPSEKFLERDEAEAYYGKLPRSTVYKALWEVYETANGSSNTKIYQQGG